MINSLWKSHVQTVGPRPACAEVDVDDDPGCSENGAAPRPSSNALRKPAAAHRQTHDVDGRILLAEERADLPMAAAMRPQFASAAADGQSSRAASSATVARP